MLSELRVRACDVCERGDRRRRGVKEKCESCMFIFLDTKVALKTPLVCALYPDFGGNSLT